MRLVDVPVNTVNILVNSDSAIRVLETGNAC
jgi:hypothetical protein